mgnify:CR=1 FL=1
MLKKSYAVGLVGATGLIGNKFIKIMEKRNFPVEKFKAFASPASAGKTLSAFGKKVIVESLDENSFSGLDLVFFSAGKEISLKFAPIAENAGAIVIDNSSAFRMNDNIPLVVPEINIDAINLNKTRIIANPNCSTVQAVLPLKYIARTYGIKRIIYSTYQAVSGSGKKGVKDLLLTRQGFSPLYYPLPISDTCICEIGSLSDGEYTEEEIKMRCETCKILGINIPVSATCIRVPTENCHLVSVEAELNRNFELSEIEREIAFTEGIKISDFPSAVSADGKGEVFVGRVRKSTAFENGISFITVADNTLKGAGLNAVQIAEALMNLNKL